MERRALAEPGRHAPVVNVPGGNETRETRVYDAAMSGATLSVGESYLLSNSIPAYGRVTGESNPYVGPGTDQKAIGVPGGHPGTPKAGNNRRLAFRDGVGVLAQEVQRGGFLGSELGSHDFGFRRLRRRHLNEQFDIAIALQAGARGDQPAHDHVFLESAQVIDLAGDSCLVENAGGLLEARGGNEGVGRERGLGDAEQEGTARGGTATLVDHAIVLLAETELIDLFVQKEPSVANVLDLHPAHHLANDGFDVFVVDVHALQAINLLDGIHQVSLRVLLAENRQQIERIERAIDERLAGMHVLAFLNVDVHAAGDRVFLLGLAVFALDVNLAHALADLAVFDDAINFADDGGILGLASLKELDDARETAGDVLGLGGFARNLGQHVSGLD